MKIDDAFDDWLFKEYEFISASWQTLYLGFLKIWTEKYYNHQIVTGIASNAIPINKFRKILNNLLNIEALKGFHKNEKDYIFFIKNTKLINKNQKPDLDPERILSGIFPYSYISHFSAMRLYGLTNIKPSAIYITVPTRPQWKEFLLEDLKKNFSFYKRDNTVVIDDDVYYEAPTLKLNKVQVNKNQIFTPYPFDQIFKDLFPDQNIIIITKKTLDDAEWWSGYHVQSISSLYLDMIKFPHYCGGLLHVTQVMKTSLTNEILNQVLEKIANFGTCLDRARFGFICEKLLHIKHPIISEWRREQEEKRGSSRKLVASTEFDPVFDPDWNLSINHEEIKNTYCIGAMTLKHKDS
ncbi:MAG: hypothetical protein ACK41T_12325 [Pseudobdellovibrio sp.]|jgi:predicted transcriptional regulator of viral defense system